MQQKNKYTLSGRFTGCHFLCITNLILVIFSLCALFKSIFISFDIDEGYAIAQSYRLITGDRMFEQMWEPHQLSSFFSALFMLPFLAVTGGDTTGIVIYLRITGSLIHLLLGLWLYFTARRQFSPTVSLLISLIHFNFLPKWVSVPEFELMHYWSVCVLFLSLLSWYRNSEKKRFLFLASVSLFTALMSYPTMIILYPVYTAAIISLSKKDQHSAQKSVLFFTLPAFLLGITLIGYILSYLPLRDFAENLSYVLSDESHSVSLGYRCREYLQELLAFVLKFLPCLLISFLLTAAIRKITAAKGTHRSVFTAATTSAAMLIGLILLCIIHLFSSVFGDTNQFYLYFRYLVAAVPGIICFFADKKENRAYFLFGICPGLISVIASAAITNMTLEIAMARLYVTVIAACFILADLLRSKFSQDKFLKGLAYTGAVFFLFSLLMCKLLLVRVTGCIPISMKMHMKPVTDGPAAGLWLKEELADIYNANTAFIKANLSEDDRLLYFGCENIYYLTVSADIATPSTQGTSVFNEIYLEYYAKYPEKLPNVVIIDKTFATAPAYNYSEHNQIILDWIAEEFEDAAVTESEYLTFLRK